MSQSVMDSIGTAIRSAIDGAEVVVEAGSPGHYSVTVTSAAFAGKPMVQAHRLVYAAIAHLMEGERPAVHAIDRLRTLAP